MTARSPSWRQSMICQECGRPLNPNDPMPRPWVSLKLVESETTRQVFASAYYSVVRLSAAGGWLLLIINADQSARRDWREFQAIKNELCGLGAVGVEIYPDERHVVDPSNAFMMRVWEPGRCPIDSAHTHTVVRAENAIAPQRSFPAAVLAGEKSVECRP